MPFTYIFKRTLSFQRKLAPVLHFKRTHGAGWKNEGVCAPVECEVSVLPWLCDFILKSEKKKASLSVTSAHVIKTFIRWHSYNKRWKKGKDFTWWRWRTKTSSDFEWLAACGTFFPFEVRSFWSCKLKPSRTSFKVSTRLQLEVHNHLKRFPHRKHVLLISVILQ